MKTTAIILVLSAMMFLVCSAEEWLVDGGSSPKAGFEIWMIPALPTDDRNGSPYRIAFRDPTNKKIAASFLWNGDITDAQFPKETRALWSPNGKFVAIHIRGGRLIDITEVYFVSREFIEPVRLPDFHQNILGRFKAVESGPNGGDSPLRWLTDSDLLLSACGSARIPGGGNDYDFLVTVRLFGETNSTRGAQLIKLEEEDTHR